MRTRRPIRRLHWSQRFFRRRSAVVGVAVVLAIGAVAVLAPYVAPYDPVAQSLGQRLQVPGPHHWLGTDEFGRDIASRIIWGSHISLEVGFAAIAIAAVTGSIIGLAAGYWGGACDAALMRIMDMLMAFPTILMAIAIAAMLRGGLAALIIAIGFASIPQLARVVRGEVLRLKSLTYIEAARSVGAGHVRVMRRHLLPNLLSVLIVVVSLRLSAAILSESTLSFLGLGISPPTPTWGTMIAGGQRFLTLAPWVAFAPGVVLTATILALNLFGDGLRDALDPRLQNQW